MAPDGRHIGVIRWPEQAVYFAFGGPDLRTLFCCAHTSVYTLRVKVPGNPHPWYKRREQQSYDASSGGVPSRSAAVPSTRSAASAMASSRSSAKAGAVNWSPIGMPARSRPTGMVIAQSPR